MVATSKEQARRLLLDVYSKEEVRCYPVKQFEGDSVLMIDSDDIVFEVGASEVDKFVSVPCIIPDDR